MSQILEEMVQANTKQIEALHEFTEGFMRHTDKRFDEILEDGKLLHNEVGSIHTQLADLIDKVDGQSGYATEIDSLLSRIKTIEDHLGIQTSLGS